MYPSRKSNSRGLDFSFSVMQYYELLIAVLGEPRLGKDTNQDQPEEEIQMSKSLKEKKKQNTTKQLEEGMVKCHMGHSC